MQVSLEEQVGGGVLNLALERRVIKAWTGERPSQALDGDGLFNREQLELVERILPVCLAARLLCAASGECFGADVFDIGDVVAGVSGKKHAMVLCVVRAA